MLFPLGARPRSPCSGARSDKVRLRRGGNAAGQSDSRTASFTPIKPPMKRVLGRQAESQPNRGYSQAAEPHSPGAERFVARRAFVRSTCNSDNRPSHTGVQMLTQLEIQNFRKFERYEVEFGP